MITCITALCNSRKLGALPCRTIQDGRVIVESSDRTWSTGEWNGKPLQYSCLKNPMNSVKRPFWWDAHFPRPLSCYWTFVWHSPVNLSQVNLIFRAAGRTWKGSGRGAPPRHGGTLLLSPPSRALMADSSLLLDWELTEDPGSIFSLIPCWTDPQSLQFQNEKS